MQSQSLLASCRQVFPASKLPKKGVSRVAQKIDFVSLLHKSQEYISENYAAALSDRSKVVQLRSYIEKYLHDSGFEVEGMTFRELSDKLYSEMAEYSVLTKYLGRDEIEEININGWDDIAVTYTDGHIEKAKEHFYNPQHAVDVVKRLLHHSGMIIDNATPMSQGHLPGNTRITALKEPLVDDDQRYQRVYPTSAPVKSGYESAC